MKRHDVLIDRWNGSAWAILPQKLEEIAAFIERYVVSEEELTEVEAVSGSSGLKAQDDYDVTPDGVAVIPLQGTLFRGANLVTRYSGGTSTQVFATKVEQADQDKRVRSILVYVNSPGGTVDGTYVAMEALRNARKPVVAYSDGLAASAAYWIASAADRILIGPSAEVGSIGVIGMHIDTTRAYDEAGIKRTLIYAGRYKAVGSEALPLDEEGRSVLQETIDSYYDLFVRSVAENRGRDIDTVKDLMADGRTWIGPKALSRGFADGLGSLDDAVALAVRMAAGTTQKNRKEKKMTLTIENLKSEHKDLYDEAFEAGRASVDVNALTSEAEEKGYDRGYAQGVEDERSRVVSLLEAEADAEATQRCIREGTSVEAAYRAFYEAERLRKVKALEAMEREAPPAMGERPESGDADTFLAKVAGYEASGLSRAKAMRKARKEYPELHKEWIAEVNQNRHIQ